MVGLSIMRHNVIRLCECVPNLSTEAIKDPKPNVHKSKTTGLKQKVAQEEGDAAIGPATVDQQQSLQKSKLGHRKVCVVDGLTSLPASQPHSNVSRWC